jgi:hypothetical protein
MRLIDRVTPKKDLHSELLTSVLSDDERMGFAAT